MGWFCWGLLSESSADAIHISSRSFLVQLLIIAATSQKRKLWRTTINRPLTSSNQTFYCCPIPRLVDVTIFRNTDNKQLKISIQEIKVIMMMMYLLRYSHGAESFKSYYIVNANTISHWKFRKNNVQHIKRLGSARATRMILYKLLYTMGYLKEMVDFTLLLDM